MASAAFEVSNLAAQKRPFLPSVPRCQNSRQWLCQQARSLHDRNRGGLITPHPPPPSQTEPRRYLPGHPLMWRAGLPEPFPLGTGSGEAGEVICVYASDPPRGRASETVGSCWVRAEPCPRWGTVLHCGALRLPGVVRCERRNGFQVPDRCVSAGGPRGGDGY